ncbi:hypothetical protein V1264_011822 [Littorina saxatilis]|uniref:Uncharacterized protein n=1 Tax=Littorina saxatilis TaxID=31220 RepID=A0AAN9GKQ1_9CAEN
MKIQDGGLRNIACFDLSENNVSEGYIQELHHMPVPGNKRSAFIPVPQKGADFTSTTVSRVPQADFLHHGCRGGQTVCFSFQLCCGFFCS